MSRLVTQIMALICLALPGWAEDAVENDIPRIAPRPLESAFHAM